MSDVFDVLRADHEEVQRMCRELATGPSVTSGATPEQLEARGQLVERLVIEESKHEAVEEEYFWPAVREFARDGNQLADQAIAQEDSAKQVLDELRQTSPDNEQFELLLARFIEDGSKHIEFEETQVWPRLATVLEPPQLRELGADVANAKMLAPTRPHPHTPAKPRVLKTAGAAAAMMDRARDAITGRGHK